METYIKFKLNITSYYLLWPPIRLVSVETSKLVISFLLFATFTTEFYMPSRRFSNANGVANSIQWRGYSISFSNMNDIHSWLSVKITFYHLIIYISTPWFITIFGDSVNIICWLKLEAKIKECELLRGLFHVTTLIFNVFWGLFEMERINWITLKLCRIIYCILKYRKIFF